jgi:ParB-like chromosome segregation protein Spo0J
MKIHLELLRLEPAAYPRTKRDEGRVAEFMQLYADGGPDCLPPIEVVPDGEGRYIGADFLHRATAALKLGWSELPALIVAVPEGADPVEVAHLRALETSVTAAKPLTPAERRRAVKTLIEHHPEWGDREIARRAGCSHQTVGRIRDELAHPQRSPEAAVSDEYLASVTAAQVTDRLVRGMTQAWDARGLTDLALRRMPATLAGSLRRTFGEEAALWAERLERWAADARQQLDRDAR